MKRYMYIIKQYEELPGIEKDYFHMAKELYHHHIFDVAGEMFLKLYQLSSYFPVRYNYWAALSFYKAKNHEKAIQCAINGLKHKPDWYMLRAMYGTILFQYYHDTQNALKQFRLAFAQEWNFNNILGLKQKKLLSLFHEQYAKCLIYYNKYDKALIYLKIAIKISENYWVPNYELGRLYQKMNKFKEADVYFNKAICHIFESSKLLFVPKLHCIIIKILIGDYNEAFYLLQKIPRNPKRKALFEYHLDFYFGLVYFKRKKYHTAKQHFLSSKYICDNKSPNNLNEFDYDLIVNICKSIEYNKSIKFVEYCKSINFEDKINKMTFNNEYSGSINAPKIVIIYSSLDASNYNYYIKSKTYIEKLENRLMKYYNNEISDKIDTINIIPKKEFELFLNEIGLIGSLYNNKFHEQVYYDIRFIKRGNYLETCFNQIITKNKIHQKIFMKHRKLFLDKYYKFVNWFDDICKGFKDNYTIIFEEYGILTSDAFFRYVKSLSDIIKIIGNDSINDAKTLAHILQL